MTTEVEPRQRSLTARAIFARAVVDGRHAHVLLWGVVFILGASLVLAAPVSLSGQIALSIGDVSPTDIRAPHQITYESQVLTEQARARAAATVPNAYDPPEARIRREQVNRAREIINEITRVRQDEYANADQQAGRIQAIPDITLSAAVVDQIVAFDDASWQRAATEVPLVLDRIMREEIREDQVQTYQRRVASLVSLDLNEREAAVVTELVRALIRPNTFFNAERTEAAREEARQRVPPQMRTIEARQIILRAGDVVDAADIEALDAFGLRRPRFTWPLLIQAVLLVLLITTVMATYLLRTAPEFWDEPRWPPLLVLITLTFLVVARLLIPGRSLLPLILPIAGMSMLLALLLDLRLALVITACVALVAGYLSNGALEMIMYFLLGGFTGAFVLGRGERLGLFAWSGITVSFTNLAVLFLFRWPTGALDLTNFAQLALVALGNGVLSVSVTGIGLVLLSSVFGITTSFQLMELSRPTQPLLRQLLLKAPGTYHHTILVSNLGERAADAVGADPLLTRVGAYYHDVGKILRPYFFVDNQADGVNPHDQLDPYTSAQIIISHVKDGIELARRHRLPARVIDFIPEHHGTTLVSYFYHKATQMADTPVDEAAFRYPGPRPRSKETAIIMLADSCESAVRASHPSSREEIDQIVHKIIHRRLLDGELDHSDLTLQDLDRIRRAFVNTLQGIHHPRIQYPTMEPSPATRVAAQAAPTPAPPATSPSPGPTSMRNQENGSPSHGVG